MEQTEVKKERRAKGEGSIYLRGKIWWIQFNKDGQRVKESSGSVKRSDAVKLLQRRLGAVVEDRFVVGDEKVTIAQLADDVVEDYEMDDKDTLDKAKRSAARIKMFFGHLKAAETRIVIQGVRKYKIKRQKEITANGTINRELAFLKRCYNLGVENGKITQTIKFPMLKESNPRTGFFDVLEYTRLRDALPEWFRPIVVFAFHIPWRIENIIELTWDRVNLADGTVRVDGRDTKNEEAMEVCLDNETLGMLEELYLKRKEGCNLVFNRDGRRITRDVREVWYPACIKAGLGQMVEAERNGRKYKKYEGKLFHDFRRTGIRNMVRSGTDEKTAMSISGHKTRSVFDRYNISSNRDRRNAAQNLERYLKEETTKARQQVEA